jgi:glycosyltransferase involved in cell wall biosynthesis
VIGIGSAPNTVIHGFVPDLSNMWEMASLSIVPLLAGSGTRLKILESLANGVPCVSTTIGAFGLDLKKGEGVELADCPREFADRCVRILRSQEYRNRIGARGWQAVKVRYSWARVQEIVKTVAHSVAS